MTPVRNVETLERMLAERTAELRESEKTFQLFAANMPVGMFIRGAEPGTYRFVNPAFRSVTGQDVAAGDPVEPVGRDMRFRHGDSTERWGHVHTFPLDDASGRATWIGGIIEDVTDRKLAQATIVNAKERLKALSRRVLAVQEEERRSISRELHDDVGQSLLALRMGLHRLVGHVAEQQGPILAQCLEVSRAILERLHELSIDLLPPQLDQLGLPDALRWLVSRQRGLTGMPIVCRIGTTVRLAAPVELACYRICQEALSNATRHAAAHAIAVELDSDGDQLILSVRDDGRGFDEEAARDRGFAGGNLGLIGMEERAQLAGGRLEMRTAPSCGTTVSAFFALNGDDRVAGEAQVLA